MIEAVCGSTRLRVSPPNGGSVLSLQWQGIDILRPAPEPTEINRLDPRESAAFPMVPFVGRIHNGAFSIEDQTIKLPANMPPEPHAIHGFGWQTAWDVVENSKSSIVLQCDHPAKDWPWSYVSRQTFTVFEDGISVELAVRNQSPSSMPAGLGWHPYFPAEDAQLSADTTYEWRPALNSSLLEPGEVSIERNFSSGRALAEIDIDHVFSLGAPTLNINWPSHRVRISSSPPTRFATVYHPTSADFFCVEPITHLPGALNHSDPFEGTGLSLLRPGDEMGLRIELRLEKAAS